jgi:hypothetical protein
VHAWLIRRHLRVPAHVTAALLGVDTSVASRALALTGQLISAGNLPLPPSAQLPPENHSAMIPAGKLVKT